MPAMENINLKFTQIAFSELKIDLPTDFCLHGLENSMVLYGNGGDFYALDMIYACDFLINIPYSIKNAKIPQEKPLAELVKDVNFMEIYKKSSVLECQELAIDHIFITDCAMEPPKPRLLRAECVPNLQNNSRICCLLTSYGVCDLYAQDNITLQWYSLNLKLHQMLVTDVFPIEMSPSDITTFAKLRTYVDTYYITAFAWSTSHVLYLGTAAGCIVAFKYIESEKTFELLNKINTSMGRISYIAICNELILAGCYQGQVLLLQFNSNEKEFKQLDFLWSKKDRMTCRQAIITFDDEAQVYQVVFCKTAHLLVFRLDANGCVVAKSSAHVRGIKITGIESFADNEFIITTLMSSIYYVKITYPSADNISIEIHTVDHDMDAGNFQIHGVAASKTRTLWSFLLFHNKDYTHQSIYTASSALLCYCKINTLESLKTLSDQELTTMNDIQDLMVAINMDVSNYCDVEHYLSFLDLSQLQCPTEITEKFIQKLQIKFTIIRQIARYQQMKLKCIKANVEAEKSLLESILKRLHILQRLQYLRTYQIVGLSEFQELSIICMQKQFPLLLKKPPTNDDNNQKEDIFAAAREQFAKVTSEMFENLKFDVASFQNYLEFCWMCQEEINEESFNECKNKHEIKRCAVSFTQLPLVASTYCPNCFALVTNDDNDLKELFGPDEVVKCTYCRYLFKNDVF